MHLLLRSPQSRGPENKPHAATPGDWPYTHKAPLARGTRHLIWYSYGSV